MAEDISTISAKRSGAWIWVGVHEGIIKTKTSTQAGVGVINSRGKHMIFLLDGSGETIVLLLNVGAALAVLTHDTVVQNYQLSLDRGVEKVSYSTYMYNLRLRGVKRC